MRRGGDAGFTLLEVLVALTVFGFLMVGLQQGLRFGLTASDRMARLSERQDSFAAAERVLRRLVEQAEPAREGPALRGGAATLFLRSQLPRPGGDAAAQEVALGVDAAQRLVLRWHAPGGTAVAEAVLLDRVAALELAYWGPTRDGNAGWSREWTSPELPRLVRISLRPVASVRAWPDIVALTTIEALGAR